MAPDRQSRIHAAALALLAVAVVACFWPLTQYFLAQDDFILIDHASRSVSSALSNHASDTPGQFRPLAKVLVFAVLYHAFGLNAFAYHALSLMLHIVNVFLLFALLRRIDISFSAALVGCTFFALSVGFFHVIAWASCVQQLLALAFALLAVRWAVDAATTGRRRRMWRATASYALALLCFEQVALLPVAAALVVWAARGSARALWPLAATMIAYLAFLVGYKSLPSSGPYAVSLGKNVVTNLLHYSAWSMHYVVDLPGNMNEVGFRFYWVFLVLFVMMRFLFARGRGRLAIAGIAWLLLGLAPVLPLRHHMFYLHTYVPAVGAIVLIATTAHEAFAMRAFSAPRVRHVAVAAVFATMSVLSFVYIRHNERTTLPGDDASARSFVLRRANIAENVYDGIREHCSPGVVGRVDLILAGNDLDPWNRGNVKAALGSGSAIRLFYGDPTLEVRFPSQAEMPAGPLPGVDVFVCDPHGKTRPAFPAD